MLRVRPNTVRDILEECISGGVISGYRRAYKHNDNPVMEAITEAIIASIMLNIEESFEIGHES